MREGILRQLQADLKASFETPKCRKCGCLRDVLIAMQQATDHLMGEDADALRMDIASFLNGLEITEYACLGCDPCPPAIAENHIFEMAGGVIRLPMVRPSPCAFTPRPVGRWPVVAGEYRVLDRQGTIAVSTLASADLPGKLAELRPKGLAIVGKLETENIGVDKVVKNVVTNPYLQILIVAGQESKGHQSGQALLALMENGVDEQQRIIGARGKRPFLRNVTPKEIERFRQQVKLVDLMGCDDAERLAAEVEARACVHPGSHRVAPLQEAPTPSRFRIQVHPSRHPLRLDKAGYFVIIPRPEDKRLIVEHYDYQDRLQHVFEGEDARSLCAAIIELGLVTQLDHAAYLGRELMRAELCLRLGLPFVQDGA